MPQVSLGRPEFVPGTPPGHPTLYRANGRGRFGGQTVGGDSKAFPWLKQPLFAVPALRELESACRVVVFCELLSQ